MKVYFVLTHHCSGRGELLIRLVWINTWITFYHILQSGGVTLVQIMSRLNWPKVRLVITRHIIK